MDLDAARDRIRGCLLAGAVGDALGAPVEFMDLAEIRRAHGPSGVRGYLPAYGRPGGAITDDTQMTLFTADGMIRSLVRYAHRGIIHVPSVMRRSYRRWLTTQGEPWPPDDRHRHGAIDGWLLSVDGLRARRAPGNTCLAALRTAAEGTITQPLNTSKGCGAVMRTAPIGLAHLTRDPFDMGAECGAITHGHPTGYLAAGFLTSMVWHLLRDTGLEGALDAAGDALRGYDGHGEVLAAVGSARELAAREHPSAERVETLGAGWVAEEALAIAVYCVLATDEPRDALLLAVNHSGDSDSTASIAGNILGALHGTAAIPPDLWDGLELRDVIERVADDMADAFYGEGVGDEYEPIDDRVQEWLRRYPGN